LLSFPLLGGLMQRQLLFRLLLATSPLLVGCSDTAEIYDFDDLLVVDWQNDYGGVSVGSPYLLLPY
jgi:hypothetical protein